MNNLLQILMNQLKMRNPQVFQQFQNLKQSQSNPMEFLNNVTRNYTPEQMNRFKQYANNFGFTDEQLKNYGINSKS